MPKSAFQQVLSSWIQMLRLDVICSCVEANFNAGGSADNILEGSVLLTKCWLQMILPICRRGNLPQSELDGVDGGSLHRYLHALLCCYLVCHCFSHFLGSPRHKQRHSVSIAGNGKGVDGLLWICKAGADRIKQF